MAWDSTKAALDTIFSADWNSLVTYLKAHTSATRPHSGHTRMNSGTYTGDNTANRAIPHGLGITPKAIIFERAGSAMGLMLESTKACYHDNGSDNTRTVTAWDATNFYVGLVDDAYALNYTSQDWAWAAFA